MRSLAVELLTGVGSRVSASNVSGTCKYCVAGLDDMCCAFMYCRRLASIQSAFHAVEAAAQAHARCTFEDTFLELAYRLVIEKLRAACQPRLRLVCLCLAYCSPLQAC